MVKAEEMHSYSPFGEDYEDVGIEEMMEIILNFHYPPLCFQTNRQVGIHIIAITSSSGCLDTSQPIKCSEM